METLWQDVRYALRGLRGAPGLSAAVVITLAIGIGANTAIFSLVNAIVLRTLPVPKPADLSLFYQSMPPAMPDIGDSNRSDIFSYQAFSRIERAAAAQLSIAAMSDAIGRVSARLGSAPTPITLSLQLVSGRFFDTLGVRPAAGRVFNADDDYEIDGEPVAVLRYGFARQQFGEVAAAIGQTIRINTAVLTVVGVAQDGFPGVFMGEVVDIYVPTVMQHAVAYRSNYSTHNAEPRKPWIPQPGLEWLTIISRAPAAEMARAEAKLSYAYREEVAAEANRRGDNAYVRRWQQSVLARESFAGGRSRVRAQFSNALFLLMAMVGVVLLIACANIANLLFARASATRTNLAIRLSLGAGRMRILRLMVLESLCLALLGAAVAMPLGTWASTGLAELASVRDLLPQRFSLESAVLLFGVGVTTVTGVLVGLVPAWRATGHTPAMDLRTGGVARITSGTRSMSVLVAGQVALSVVVVATAALLGQTLVNLRQFELGFEREHLVSFRVSTPDVNAFQPIDLLALRDELLRRARGVPGVLGADVSTTGTLTGDRSVGEIRVDGYMAAPGEQVRAQVNRVGARYFQTVGMQLRDGRFLDETDSAERVNVALVNETFARRYAPGRSAIGVRIGYGDELRTQIVGVVSDARVNGLREAATPMVFYPLAQQVDFPRYVDVRVNGDPTIVGTQLQQALADMDPRVRIGQPTPIEVALSRDMSRDRLMALVSIAFAAIALLLACVGTYGVLAYGVSRRIREMGVRAALGATPSALTSLVIGEGLRIVMPGLIAGVAVALAGARLIEAQLFGVNPYDFSIHVAVVVTLLVTVLIACYLPARRAAGISPAVSLRAE